LILNSGSVFSFGTNLNGQLGQGNFNAFPTPTQITLGKSIVSIAAGGAHSVLVTSEGTVYTFGRNTFGQLCNGDVGGSHPTPTLVEDWSDVASAAAGWGHTVFLTTGGTLKSCGRNADGELGVGNTLPQYTPQTVDGLSDVKKIACGAKHTLAATANKVYAFGSNSHSQLCKNVVSVSTPVEVDTHSMPATALAAGLYHSLFLLDNSGTGKAFGCGFNKFFQIGLVKANDASTQADEPEVTHINTITDSVTKIAAGAYHSVFMTSTNKVYTTGKNYDGQLGRTTETHYGKKPETVTLTFTPTDIAAGGGVTVVKG
jgi:alpha-tubulin suppressor-like RCC1 family protein